MAEEAARHEVVCMRNIECRVPRCPRRRDAHWARARRCRAAPSSRHTRVPRHALPLAAFPEAACAPRGLRCRRRPIAKQTWDSIVPAELANLNILVRCWQHAASDFSAQISQAWWRRTHDCAPCASTPSLAGFFCSARSQRRARPERGLGQRRAHLEQGAEHTTLPDAARCTHTWLRPPQGAAQYSRDRAPWPCPWPSHH